jgi:uncharacterized iron-regulated membrane protein
MQRTDAVNDDACVAAEQAIVQLRNPVDRSITDLGGTSNCLACATYSRCITLPTSATGAVLFRLAPPHAENRGDYVQLSFDQYSGKLLSDIDSRRLGFPIRAVLFMGPLHFGSFIGHWSKITWIVVGLSPSLLFFTGIVMWVRRIRRKRRS